MEIDMARAVGVDIGSKSLKILELESSGSKLYVRHFFNLEVRFTGDDEAELDLLTEPIRAIFHDHRLEQNNVAVSVPTEDCILREISMDFDQDEHIRKIIKFEAEKYLQSYPIEDVVIDFCKLQVIAKNKSKVFFTAVPKKIIAARLTLLEKCEMDPLTVDLDIMALINLARLSPAITQKDTVMVVDIGAVSTKLAILAQGELRYIRAIRVGASSHELSMSSDETHHGKTGALSARLENIDWELEKQLIVSLPVPDGTEVERMVLVKRDTIEESSIENTNPSREHEVFDRLMREIKRTTLNLDMDTPVQLICLTGGGCQIQGISERFQESFNVETIMLRFPEKVLVKEEMAEETRVFGPVALGLAMGLLDKEYKGMNFRKEEFQYTNRFEFLRIPIATLVSLFFLLVLPWAYHFQDQRIRWQEHYNKIVEKADMIWKRNFQSDSLEVDKFEKVTAVSDKFDEEIQQRRRRSVPAVPDGFWRWQAIFAKFAETREKGHYLTINRFNLDTYKASWEGAMENIATLDTLRRAMIGINIKGVEIDPADDQTGGTPRGNNPETDDKRLQQIYSFQVGFKEAGTKKE